MEKAKGKFHGPKPSRVGQRFDKKFTKSYDHVKNSRPAFELVFKFRIHRTEWKVINLITREESERDQVMQREKRDKKGRQVESKKWGKVHLRGKGLKGMN